MGFRHLIDADLPDLAARLGIDGFVDIHTHFMPESVQQKVWAYFARGALAAPWDLRYRGSLEARVGTLERLGVVQYTALAYAHKPGMASWLNEFTLDLGHRLAPCVPSATFYPEPDAGDYVADAIGRGVRVFKVHLVVGGFDPWHPMLRDVWAQIERAGVSVVVHAGAYPNATPWTGAVGLGAVLAAHPRLRVVIAHMGKPDMEPLYELCHGYPQIKWDTTMVFTRFWRGGEPVPPRLLRLVADRPDRIVFGTDFPSIPHAYAHQIDVLRRLGHGDDWLKVVLHDSGREALTPAPTHDDPT